MVAETLANGARSSDERIAPQRVVLKFGGTSIGKFAPQIAKICLYPGSPSTVPMILRSDTSQISSCQESNRGRMFREKHGSED